MIRLCTVTMLGERGKVFERGPSPLSQWLCGPYNSGLLTGVR